MALDSFYRGLFLGLLLVVPGAFSISSAADTSANRIVLNLDDWTLKAGTQARVDANGVLRLTATDEFPVVADALLAKLAGKASGADALNGVVSFEYRATSSAGTGDGASAVVIMRMGRDKDGVVREVSGRRSLVLKHDAAVTWKNARLEFVFDPATSRGAVLRFAVGQGEIPGTTKGASSLEIRNLRFAQAASASVDEKLASLVDYAQYLKIRAPRGTWVGPQDLVTGRFMEKGGYYALFPDADNPDNNWIEIIVPSITPVRLHTLAFRRLGPTATTEQPVIEAPESYLLTAYDGSEWRNCPLSSSTDARLVFDVPEGIRSTQFRLHLREPGRTKEYRLYQINGYGDPKEASRFGSAGAVSLVRGGNEGVFAEDEPLSARVQVSASRAKPNSSAEYRVRLLDHYGEPWPGVQEIRGTFSLMEGLDREVSWPRIPPGSYRVDTEVTVAGHVVGFDQTQEGVRGAWRPYVEPSTVAQVKKPRLFYSVLGHYYSRPQKFPISSLRHVREAGYDGVSLFLHWSELEPLPGVYNLGHLDDTLRRCSELGLAVELYIGVGDHSTPAWVDASQFQRDQTGQPVGPRWYFHLPGDEPGRIPSPQAPAMTEAYPQLYGTLADHYSSASLQLSWYIGPPALEEFFWTTPWAAKKGLISDYSEWNVQGFRTYLRDELGLDLEAVRALWSTPVNDWADVLPVKPAFANGYDLRPEGTIYQRYKQYVAASYYTRCITAVTRFRPADRFGAGELAEFPLWEADKALVERVGRGGAEAGRIAGKLHSIDTDVNAGPALGVLKSRGITGGYEHGWVPPRKELFNYGFFNLFTNGFALGDFWRWQGEPVFNDLWSQVKPLREAVGHFAGAAPEDSGIAALISSRSFGALERFSYKWGPPAAAPGAPLYRVKGGLIGALADMEYQWGQKLSWLPVEAGLPDLSGKRLIFDLYSFYLPSDAQEKLLAWVRGGGTLVLSGASGFRESPDSPEASLRQRLAGVTGLPVFHENRAEAITVNTEVLPTTRAFGMNLYQDTTMPGAEPVAKTRDGQVAVSLRPEGKGRIVLLHGDLNGFRYGDYRTFLTDLRTLATVPPSPVVVESGLLQAMMTRRGDERFLFVYHHADTGEGDGVVQVSLGHLARWDVRCLYPAATAFKTETTADGLRITVKTKPYDLLIFSIKETGLAAAPSPL
ncbi:MAG: beta-galactosidase [Opitutaceae bacterium]|jgi:hypothetical protein